MSAIVTDQFRIANANNFVESVLSADNNYYVFLGLSNPGTTSTPVGFGRTSVWGNTPSNPPSPIDNQQYLSQYRNTALFGKKLNNSNIRRVVRKINWTTNNKYEMYRHDYSIANLAPISQSARLYDSNYYVVNSEFKVYICIYNGSHGNIGGASNLVGNSSKDEPTFTDLEVSSAGTSGDGYLWKYLFTISPSDIIKFDSTEYIVLPSDWSTSTDFQIQSVRDSGDSTLNNNQIKYVYIEDGGSGIYTEGTYNIKGDGSGAKVNIEVNTSGTITKTTVVSGGSGYTFGIVDFGHGATDTISNPAKLIPIIPPSRGHGFNLYEELGSDKVLIYSRFDDSTKDFPTNTKFSQVGIIKNPEKYNSSTLYSASEYSSLGAIKLTSDFSDIPSIGNKIEQETSDGSIASGYIASYDVETKILKYYQDRSLNFGNTLDQTDRNDVTSKANVISFESSSNAISDGSFSGSIDTGFAGLTTAIGSKIINLGVTFSGGLADPEINKNTGDVIYIDNRSLVTRDSRQKEDIKIILEF